MSVRTERLIRIYNRLRRGPVTIEIISKWAKGAAIQVSDRQLYRDLNELKSLQIAEGENVVEFVDEKNRKTWKLEYDEESEKFSQFDINSFYLLKNFAPYAILEARRSSLEKLEKTFYKSLSKNKYQQHIQGNELYLRKTNFNENMYGPAEHKQIEEVIWALHNNRQIIIEKEKINPANIHFKKDAFPVTMCPLELIFHRGRAHISGLSENHDLLIFSIDKSLVFHLTNTPFNRKKLTKVYKNKMLPLFGISEPQQNKTYSVKLEFTREYGESMKNFFWHHTQKWSSLKNGNYMLELKCSIGRELVGFIAVGLDKVKVHQPKVLRELMIKKYNRTVFVYETDTCITEEEANKDY